MVKLYTEKTAITSADILNDRVIPFFTEHNIRLTRILTDRGTEYCGNVENHAYQLYLGIEDIDHSKTKVRSPQTNGICERFHRTIKDECYNILFRKKIYRSPRVNPWYYFITALRADLNLGVLVTQHISKLFFHPNQRC